MERGDIYLISLDLTAAAQPQGQRPVLVVSPGSFNRVTWTPIVLPITSGAPFVRTAGFAVSLTGVGMRTGGIVHCDQPHAVDLTARGGRLIERVPLVVMEEVLARLNAIFR
jgi:mRNA interferase ChpB